MVRVYRSSDCELIGLGGYGRKYVADVVFRQPIDSAGFIWVKIPGGVETAPHAHEFLEEAFVIMKKTKMGVGSEILDLDEGDVVVTEPGEAHWFVTPEGEDVIIIAIKMPNMKDDKVTPE
jgi:mannose-6-phosphate isomerase-like protein (cupin superfamily)